MRRLAASGEARRIRLTAGLSLSEMAAAANGVSVATVYRWETGERSPRGDAAIAYGRTLARLQRELAP